MTQISDEAIKSLLEDLDDYAREHDSYEYGLPMYGDPLVGLTLVVRRWLEVAGSPDTAVMEAG